MTQASKWIATVVMLLAFIDPARLMGQAPAGTIEGILAAHNAQKWRPESIRITGRSIRKAERGPVTITATRLEEVLFDYGDEARITTAGSRFHEKNGRIVPESTPGGFSQLDVTGLFALAHMADRPIAITASREAVVPDAIGRRIRISSKRSELHNGRFVVRDDVDVYVNPSGTLAGISRSFYDELPRFSFTMAFTFSDYRDTDGVLLPYQIDRYVKGHRVETIIVSSYEVDIVAPPEVFRRGGAR